MAHDWQDGEKITRDLMNDLEKRADEKPTTANKSTPGLVKQCAFVAEPAGETVTKAEFNALRTALIDAGIMAGS